MYAKTLACGCIRALRKIIGVANSLLMISMANEVQLERSNRVQAVRRDVGGNRKAAAQGRDSPGVRHAVAGQATRRARKPAESW